MATRSNVRWDAKTIGAIALLITAVFGGLELRMAVNRLESKIDRAEERLVRLERELAPRQVARVEQ